MTSCAQPRWVIACISFAFIYMTNGIYAAGVVRNDLTRPSYVEPSVGFPYISGNETFFTFENPHIKRRHGFCFYLLIRLYNIYSIADAKQKQAVFLSKAKHIWVCPSLSLPNR